MPQDHLRYDILTQEALLGMIAKVLAEVGQTGLPGEHHFFITFDTTNQDVQLSSRMREQYPEDMTIVVQHRFWDLEVKDTGFQIGLSFDDVAEHLYVPFSAIRGFYDPSVKFGLQFELQVSDNVEKLPNQKKSGKKKKASKKSRKQTEKSELFENEFPEGIPDTPLKSAKDNSNDENSGGEKSDDEKSGGQVVSLDSFRKKK